MINDLSVILYWWFLLFLWGLAAFPLTWLLFRNFWDFGYPFTKVTALLFISYFVWLGGSLHILPFNVFSIWLVFFLFLGFNLFLARKNREELKTTLRSRWPIFLIEEFFFFLALAVWSLIRGFQPDIEGLEKFMDFGFVNSILQGKFFPPADMWMAGKTINYYYFGHLVAAVLTRASEIASNVTYNLMIGTLFAFTSILSFSLTSNLLYLKGVKSRKTIILGGVISGFLVSLGGNLHPLWWFLTHGNMEGYWYPDATRFIVEKFGAKDNTIHEFPIYSFVVSDLHGHVSNIPFVMFSLALMASIYKVVKKTLFDPWTIIALSLVFAVMYMTNAWDFPIYLMVLGLAVMGREYLQKEKLSTVLTRTIFFGGVVIFLSLLFSLPFTLHFSQIAQGIGFVRSHTPFPMLLVLWGYQWTIALGFLVFLVISKKLQATNFKLQITDILVLIFLFVATLLIILPEIIYIKDIYIASYHRANTMFKFVYQSFVLYGLVSGYILVRLWQGINKTWPKFILYTLYFILLLSPIIYPYFAVNSYYGVFNTGLTRSLGNYRGLEGLSFLARQTPGDYAGILWLKENVSGQPTVLEAAGDSYTDFDRVSMSTGLPTVQGWLVHEWLWRGSFDEPGKRASEVETIFTTKDQALASALLKRYKVKYIFIGSKEREKYLVYEDKFTRLGNLVFSQADTKIYSLDRLSN
ncbi:MAG: DUF2298 domain-containing protein [bacterium]|nr:DUF2298 domain-containing protein [bacterium]